MNSSFYCREYGTTRTVGYGCKASATSIQSLAQLSRSHCMAHLVTERNNWGTFLRKLERWGTELQMDASIRCVSITLNLCERQNISTEWCSFSKCHCCEAVLRAWDFRPLDRESRPTSWAPRSTDFTPYEYCLWRNLDCFMFCKLRTTMK